MIRNVIKDITTAKDGESFDIARVVIAVNSLLLIPVLMIGIAFYIYGYCYNRPFDIQGFFTAILTFEGGVGALLTSGAAAIALKRQTEPDGSSMESVRITREGDTTPEAQTVRP